VSNTNTHFYNTAVQLPPTKTYLKLHDKVLLAVRSLADVSQSAETEFGAENTHTKENHKTPDIICELHKTTANEQREHFHLATHQNTP
jgi:hypothetical protein